MSIILKLIIDVNFIIGLLKNFLITCHGFKVTAVINNSSTYGRACNKWHKAAR